MGWPCRPSPPCALAVTQLPFRAWQMFPTKGHMGNIFSSGAMQPRSQFVYSALRSLKHRAAQTEQKEDMCLCALTCDLQKQAALGGCWALLDTSSHGPPATCQALVHSARATGRPSSLTYQQKQQSKHHHPLGMYKDEETWPSCTGFWKGRMGPCKCKHRTSRATFQPGSCKGIKGSS